MNLRENGWWYGELLGNRRLRWDPARIAKDRELIEALSPADLRETFRAYFPLDRYTVVSLLPAPGVTAKE